MCKVLLYGFSVWLLSGYVVIGLVLRGTTVKFNGKEYVYYDPEYLHKFVIVSQEIVLY